VFLQLVLWDLADSMTNVGELRHALADELDAGLPGLRLRAWISDEGAERWGAISIWESRDDADQSSDLERARELIGKDPVIGEEFDVEALSP
jgi:hypothetical protein